MTEKAYTVAIEPVSDSTTPSLFTNYAYVGRDNEQVFLDFHYYDVNAIQRHVGKYGESDSFEVRQTAALVSRLVMSPGMAETVIRLLQAVIEVPAKEEEPSNDRSDK